MPYSTQLPSPIVMHPYGGTPICPRCSKAVYAAEQKMGPGRKLYHKPCLACMTCNKRLDSYTLLEHDEQPYCKACHLKNFGTRNLRHANLPVAPLPTGSSPPTSPLTARPLSIGSEMPRLKANRSLASSPVTNNFPRGTSPQQPDSGMTNYRRMSWGSARGSTTPEEDEVRKALIPKDDGFVDGAKSSAAKSNIVDGLHHADDAVIAEQHQLQPQQSSNSGRPGIGTLPRTTPLNVRHRPSSSLSTIPQENFEQAPPDDNAGTDEAEVETDDVMSDLPPPTLPPRPTPTSPATRQYTGNGGFGTYNSLSNATSSASSPSPRGGYAPPPMLKPSMTGTRYGMALSGGVGTDITGGGISAQMTGSPRRQWGSGAATPQCPRCAKSVYFAEQVKAVGKTFHKACLRCTECGTTLDSNRLRDHDGDPYCVRCYGKNYGPQGGGYALLGKAGG